MKRKRFGEVALDLGYLDGPQLLHALDAQQRLRARGNERLIGLVMLEMGLLNNFQLVNVLKEMGTGTP